MDAAEAIRLRLAGQRVWNPTSGRPEEVVAELVAMQGQEFPYALWSVAQRIGQPGRPTAADLGVAYDLGAILRTHVLRPTWHLVTPADARWLLALTAPRVHALGRSYYAAAGLDAPTLVKVTDVLAAEVAGGRHRTRSQLKAALEAAGFSFTVNGLAYAVMFAELERVLISGVTIGKQRSYAEFDERVPPTFVDGAAAFDRENALATLAARYIAGRGPASAKDLATWSGLTLGDARSAIALARDRAPDVVVEVEVDGVAQWMSAGAAPADPPSPRADLVQGYDEYAMSYSETRGVMLPAGYLAPSVPVSLLHAALIDGRLVGMWKHVLRRTDATVELHPIVDIEPAGFAALHEAARDYGRYLGVPVTLEIV